MMMIIHASYKNHKTIQQLGKDIRVRIKGNISSKFVRNYICRLAKHKWDNNEPDVNMRVGLALSDWRFQSFLLQLCLLFWLLDSQPIEMFHRVALIGGLPQSLTSFRISVF